MASLPATTVALGNPPSSEHQMSQIELADWMTEYEALAGSSGLSYIDGTLANLEARVGTEDGEYGLVLNDTVEGGVYERIAGVWTKKAAIPSIFTAPGIAAHEARTDNPHAVTKAQIGLANVDNTADVDKPISTPQKDALDGKATAAQGAKADTAVQPGAAVSVLAETATAKIMTDAERAKLAGVAAGATSNAADSDLRDRATHTGAQAISTVTGLQDALDGKASTAVGTAFAAHAASVENPHAVTKAQVGLANVDNTADADKPVSAAQQGAIDALRLGIEIEEEPGTVPASQRETVIKTADGYAFMVRDENLVVLGSARFLIDGAFGAFHVKTVDGFRLLSFDAATGGAQMVLSDERFFLSGSTVHVDGVLCPGIVTAIHGSGDYFGYSLDSPEFTGAVIGRRTGDWAAPHLADTAAFEVIEADGQSWQSISDYTPEEVEFEDSSGETAQALRDLLTPMVSCLRDASDVGVIIPDDDLSALFDTISDGDQPGDLHRFVPRLGYSISRMAAACRARFQRRFGLPANHSIVLNVGWPGTTSEKFLPQGSSYVYTDDLGAAQITTASPHPSLPAGTYLWDNNIAVRESLASVLRSKYFDRPGIYNFLTWIQGPFADYGNAFGFMSEYREQQDALSIPGQSGPRHILWDQNGGRTDAVQQSNGIQAVVDFCQANASGYDWCVGPRYPHWLRDQIHHSAFGALEYAERTAQAMAYIQKYGFWEPVWITDVDFNGPYCVLTISRPRQAPGDLELDTSTLDPATNFGFSLWDVDANQEIPIATPVLSGDTVTLTAGSTISGNIRVGYADRSASARTLATVSNPNHSATWGNVMRAGRDAPAVIPSSVRPVLNHYLCANRSYHSV